MWMQVSDLHMGKGGIDWMQCVSLSGLSDLGAEVN